MRKTESDYKDDPRPTPIALTIAGSDSGGGAGIQADLKAFSALGAYGASVITALTAQNTRAVTDIHAVPPAFIREQFEAVWSDIEVTAIKIGMLATPDVIDVVAECIETASRDKPVPVVLDPVMIAKSGDKLLADNAINTLRQRLMPLATVLTPNLPEAAVLLDSEIAHDEPTMEHQGRQLLALGCENVLIKGGHLAADAPRSTDYLVQVGSILPLPADRVFTTNTHGTGCTLSSSIAARLAHGDNVETAVRTAKRYVTEAIAAADTLKVGQGHGPVHHFHKFW